MIIYQETKAGFISDVDANRLQARLVDAFRSKTGSVPSDQYVWADEYSRFSLALRNAKVADDVQVAIEYHISAVGRFRVDVLLAGSDGQTDNGMIIELKAWETASLSDIPDMVNSPVGGGKVTQHPCVQARGYKGMIMRFNRDVREKAIQLHSSAYLFNLQRRSPEPLEDPRYQSVLSDTQLFLAGDSDKLAQFLERTVPRKPKQDVMFILENGRLAPSDELIARVSSMLDGNEDFQLVDEQNVAFQVIRHQVADEKDLTHRHVFIVEGGPGTGKSVIAMRLLAELLKQKRMGFFVAPNKAFRDTLIAYMARGNKGYREDGRALLHSSWSFHSADYKKDQAHEVLIVDEAHRLKGQGAYQYRGISMVEDMVRAARISVFFIDEKQRVSWQDIGTIDAIKEAARKFNAKLHDPISLTAQFRCNGSEGYLNWLDDVLQLQPTGNFDNWGDGQYELKVFDRAEELYAALKAKNEDNKARLIAGYSWEWPAKGRERGTTTAHVEADGLALPWNFSGENWATSRDGIEQVGCVHTSQGLEFDWMGVLIGEDLTFKNGRVEGDPSKRARTDVSLKGWKRDFEAAAGDPVRQQKVLDRVQAIIKSTYKVLLSRGRKGCYVWCADEDLREYLKQRLALVSSRRGLNAAAEVAKPVPLSVPNINILPEVAQAAMYSTHLPLYSLAAAAGGFSDSQSARPLGWVAADLGRKLTPDMFVARVKGRSMEPLIPDGSYCVFRRDHGGSRDGKIVLVEHSSLRDRDTGARYTVKKYRSEKELLDDGSWRHKRITLSPANPEFSDIVLEDVPGHAFRIAAEFVAVLS